MVLEQAQRVKIGDRVEVAGHRGTVKYTGSVIGTKGEWIGVDWDDPSRGKHNGTHDGVQYFTARCSTSGSFIRPEKITPPISCLEAFRTRYGLIEENAGVDLNSLAQVQKDIRAKLFEVVGAEKINRKQSQFESLVIVSLREQPINGAGPPGALSLMCPNIRELDLSKTLIKSWSSAGEIAVQLPRLQLLNISDNRLEIDKPPEKAFNNLEHLVLAHADLDWANVLKCCHDCPILKNLQVPFNKITSITPADNILSNLSTLDLKGNSLEWSEVNKLGTLPKLTALNVSACGIREIHLPNDENEGTSHLFKNLQTLLLMENNIADWRAISELDKLPSLQELKCLTNPILEHENFDTNYQLIIARIRNITILNGRQILAEERRGAELDFLKRHGREYLSLKSDDDRSSFHKNYPCYERLVKVHGAPEESELPKPPASLKNTLIQVQLFSSQCPEKIVKKKVLRNMTVQKLTGLVQRMFDTGTSVPKLFCLHSRGDGLEVELDNEMKDLNFFSVEDGSQIVVRW